MNQNLQNQAFDLFRRFGICMAEKAELKRRFNGHLKAFKELEETPLDVEQQNTKGYKLQVAVDQLQDEINELHRKLFRLWNDTRKLIKKEINHG